MLHHIAMLLGPNYRHRLMLAEEALMVMSLLLMLDDIHAYNRHVLARPSRTSLFYVSLHCSNLSFANVA